MDSESTHSVPIVDISVEQSKLLSSAKRIQIISCLQNSAKTSKQVSVELGQSPGSTHYHIIKLYEGGLIDLVETRTEGGIIEKYYLAKSKWYNTNTNSNQFIDPILAEDSDSSSDVSTSRTMLSLRLFLTPSQREELTSEFKDLLEKWVENTSESHGEDVKEFAVGIKLLSVNKIQGNQ
ncbi:DNA-binding transcriptional ArsR family regulator [Paenibacillus sp. DS2015]|uniref:ArsR family transcriptional regulator n=1 Tax=Paenibacillus sp. DS2015 TaxID=3373917 RepID=UPI003D19B766